MQVQEKPTPWPRKLGIWFGECGLAPSEIAFATFTRAAAREIAERTTDLPGLVVGTLHHLAGRLTGQDADGQGIKLSPLANDDLARLRWIDARVIEAIESDPALLTAHVTRQWARTAAQAEFSGEPVALQVPPDGTWVRSLGEARVALALHLSGIRYRYEERFDVPAAYSTRAGAQYRPDFYIPDDPDEPTQNAGGVWLEHFGTGIDGRASDAMEAAGYTETRQWKEHLHRRLGTRLVITEYADIQRYGARFPNVVMGRLRDAGWRGAKLEDPHAVDRILRDLRAQQGVGRPSALAREIDAWIRTVRQSVSESPPPMRNVGPDVQALADLGEAVRARYEAHLRTTRTTDYEGMIRIGRHMIETGRARVPWRAVLIDEYQDVNPAQAAFVHAITRSHDPEQPGKAPMLTAVGDDWQSIYGFQGGEVRLIRDFTDPAGHPAGPAERVVLRQTYRFGQKLADVTRLFALQDRNARDRSVVGAKERRPPRRRPSAITITSARLTPAGQERLGGQLAGLTSGVLAALEDIADHGETAKGSVLVLARRNADLQPADRAGGSEIGLDPAALEERARALDLQVECSTVHGAKGREADFVIVLDPDPKAGGSPGAGQHALSRALGPLRGANAEPPQTRSAGSAMSR